MELTPDDKRVIELLSKLKNSNGTYPADFLASRRQTFLKQVANVGQGLSANAGSKNSAKGNGTGAITTATSKLLEIALVTAIAIEAGTAAYLYHSKIADLVKTYTGTSNVQQVSPLAEDTLTPVPEAVEIEESPSATALTPSGTPSPEIVENSNNNDDANNNANNDTGVDNNAGSSVNATPDPSGNNGNHYGQTPKPVRTKDNGNNNGGNSNSGGNGNNNGGGNGNGNGKNNKP